MYNVIVSAPEYNSSLEFLGYYCSIVCGTSLCTLCTNVSVYGFRAFTYLSRWFCCCRFIVSCCSHCLCFLCVWSSLCYAVHNVLSSFAIIAVRKRELAAFFDCLPAVVWLFVFCVSFSWVGG